MVTHVSPQVRNAAIPAELKNARQWATWSPADKRKKPLHPDGSPMFWKTKPESRLPFEEVAQSPHIETFITAESGIIGVDFDGCIDETGEIHPLVKGWLGRTYAEISPSETGIKMWIRGSIPNNKSIENTTVPWGTGDHTGIEVYADVRPFTVTGNIIDGCPSEINEAPEVLNDILTRFAKAPKVRGNPTPSPTTRNWDIDRWVNQHLEVVEKLADGYIVVCPWAHEHSTDHNTARIWSGPPHTFNCFHAHCDGREWNDVRLKHESTAYDKRESPLINEIEDRLRKERKGTEGEQEKKELPEFIIEGQLRDQVKEALKVLRIANEKETRMFVYLSTISKIEYDEKGDPIIMQLEKAGLRNELSDAADFKTWKKVKEERFLVDAHPPKDLAEQLLALAPRKWGLPSLKAIVEAPVLRSDGSVLTRPGYDQQTGLYYIPSSGMENCEIPEEPSQQDAIAAMGRLKALFADFPFEGPADYANTIALLFTPFVRYAVKKDIQMALIDATNAGTGKGLITIVVSIVATGRSTTPISAKQNDEEWRKAIFAELLRAPRIVIIDNIRGILESATLELMLTGNGLNERFLGQSKSAKPKNEATWMATGNNLLIGGDLPRRCYRIRLISKTATPEERDDFSIKDLEQHTIDTRSKIVSDVLTVACAWYAAGKPQPSKVPNLGTFTDWAKTVGGMLEFAGVEGFQSNRVELRSRNNEEAQQWEAFLSALRKMYGNDWNLAGTIAKEIRSQRDKAKENIDPTQPSLFQSPAEPPAEPPATPLFDSLPLDLKKSLAEKEKGFAVTLAIALKKRVQTVYGKDGYRIENSHDPHRGQDTYRVSKIDPQEVAGGSPSHQSFEKNNLEKKEESQKVDSDPSPYSDFFQNSNGGDNLPQPPASKKENPTVEKQKPSSNGSTSSFSPVDDKKRAEQSAGGLDQSAGGLDRIPAIYTKDKIPTEYLMLFTDYQLAVKRNALEDMKWHAPNAGITLPGLVKKADHVDYTNKLLKSGDSYRVKAAVEAMHRTLGVQED